GGGGEPHPAASGGGGREELRGSPPAGTYSARVNLQAGGTVVPASRYVLRFQEFSEGLHFIGPTHPYRALSGNVYIFGQLLNNTSTLRLQPTLTVTWLDANGRALRRVGGRAYVLVLAPRQRTPFAVNTGPLPAGAGRGPGGAPPAPAAPPPGPAGGAAG